MSSNQTSSNPALDLEFAFVFVVISVLAGYFANGATIGMLFGALAAMLYLLYRIWWSVELIATQL